MVEKLEISLSSRSIILSWSIPIKSMRSEILFPAKYNSCRLNDIVLIP